MGVQRWFVPVLLLAALSTFACVYVVLPEGVESSGAGAQGDGSEWVALATNIAPSEAGALHVDLAIRNDTGVWSTMRAVDDAPAVLRAADGAESTCETVFVGTGGHRLAPGFQIRGYTREQEGQAVTQMIYVECDDAPPAAGSTLQIDYYYFLGEVDYYIEIGEENRKQGRLKVNLDDVAADLTYPVAEIVEGLIQPQDIEITALSDNVVKLLDVERTGTGIRFTWQNFNPYKFALKTHIGIPPVLGEDGVIYGLYETLDIPPVPLTPAAESVQWTTEAPVPADVGGLYILLSVESKKPRTYANYAVDITDE